MIAFELRIGRADGILTFCLIIDLYALINGRPPSVEVYHHTENQQDPQTRQVTLPEWEGTDPYSRCYKQCRDT